MLIEHNELSPTDLISIAEEPRGDTRNERHCHSYSSMHNNNTNKECNAAATSLFSLQESAIT